MKPLYLDTSALVKRYYEEPGTKVVGQLFRDAPLIFTSKIAYAETISAFMRKKRESELSSNDYQKVLKDFKRDWEHLYIVIELSDAVVKGTEILIESYWLRGFDAIHLASAQIAQKEIGIDFAFCCADNSLLDAAKKEGFEGIDPAWVESEISRG